MLFIRFQVIPQEHAITDDPVAALFGIDGNRDVPRAMSGCGNCDYAVENLTFSLHQLKLTPIKNCSALIDNAESYVLSLWRISDQRLLFAS